MWLFFSAETTESELCRVFSAYGNVKSTKIIVDRAGVSKGYGFVTFDTPAVIDSLMVWKAFVFKSFEAFAGGGFVTYVTWLHKSDGFVDLKKGELKIEVESDVFGGRKSI